jgi:hypothetical protein
MHAFLELWSPKPSWISMSKADRQAIVDQLGKLTTPIVQSGSIDVLGWGKADPAVDHPEGRQYFSVWRAPTREALDKLRAAIVQGGWYEHFDQVNVTGELTTPDAVIAEHLSM